MSVTELDTRAAILQKLDELERKLPWLAEKTGISYDTLYHCIVRESFNISYFNLETINKVLQTDYPYSPTRKKTAFNKKITTK